MSQAYVTENPYASAKELLTAPLYKKYEVREAIVKCTTALFPFMLFAALFAFLILPLGKLVPSLLDGLYWVSYMSIQLFGIGFALLLANALGGFMAGLTGGVVAAYFGLFATGVAGLPVIKGSSVIGFMGYLVLGLLAGTAVKYLHRVCIVVIEWGFTVVLGFLNKKMPAGEKRDELVKGLRPMMKNMVLLGDSLIVMALAALGTFFLMQYAYALPMTALAHAVADLLEATDSVTVQGLLIGFSLGFDVGGPVSLAVFERIFAGILVGSQESARLLTVYTAAMITPAWITLAYLFVGKKFKKWPLITYDENLLNTGFINEFFQNTRLMAMSPMTYALREPDTAPFAYIAGTSVTGLLAAVFSITNETLLTKYAQNYGLLRNTTTVLTENYDAFAGLQPPLYAGGGVKVIALSFLAAFLGAAVGVAVLVGLKAIKYRRQEKRGEDLFLAFGYGFTKADWEQAYSGKSALERRLAAKFNA